MRARTAGSTSSASAIQDGTLAIDADSRRGSKGSPSAAGPSAIATLAIASSDVVYVFVAATASSGPAARSIANSAIEPSALAGSLVIASVGAPWRRADSTTPTTSGDAPDWLIPMTSARSRRGATPYSDTRDGVASATCNRSTAPSRYCA